MCPSITHPIPEYLQSTVVPDVVADVCQRDGTSVLEPGEGRLGVRGHATGQGHAATLNHGEVALPVALEFFDKSWWNWRQKGDVGGGSGMSRFFSG